MESENKLTEALSTPFSNFLETSLGPAASGTAAAEAAASAPTEKQTDPKYGPSPGDYHQSDENGNGDRELEAVQGDEVDRVGAGCRTGIDIVIGQLQSDRVDEQRDTSGIIARSVEVWYKVGVLEFR